ncbi:putative protein kinase AGC-RSK-2 family [Helianthus annuus]|uniref:non-specific serine/threonine protein kinase n=1 Tax=Helianthus annuus TaxID=4232 RepID=A0A251UX95_HELAN|nr:phototropin-1 isoform X1 [Helianthus annuus]XP_035844954.1 phototropin-1 isoform X1 [Helianthus annuus]KAJ0588682.1 putative protein kinase AGC-RSK-2 family [Helianthus annuus]KAJ0926690.1 putative protein kinase AGC-RSK-2 family [Helianthus annuus]
MESKQHAQTNKSSPLFQPGQRDIRGSLEVFNPSTHQTTAPFRSQPTWRNWVESPQNHPEPPQSTEVNVSLSASHSGRLPAAEIKSWMALKDPNPYEALPVMMAPQSPSFAQSSTRTAVQVAPPSPGGIVGKAEQRAAEWGLVLKTDEETGKPKGVKVRTSSEDPNAKPGSNRRDSGNSVQSSSDISDDGLDAGKERGFPRVSEDLKDALSTFKQTFVVSDATKPDYPILYASAGFFKMTGYTSKEVIGRNCRFLQGADTDPEDVAKIREALQKGATYCGRLLNYKKDGSPFWNLLTVSPIKDESGNILKFIGMLVEVSKHTEGAKEKMIRPNGLPGSLIRYDARQKDMATSSVVELVEAVKRPRSFSESTQSHPFATAAKTNSDQDQSDILSLGRRKSAETTLPRPPPPHRRNSHAGIIPMQPINELQEKKPKKSKRLSFVGIKKKNRKSSEEFDDGFDGDVNIQDTDGEADDEDDFENKKDCSRPESLDDKVRKKEMRKGIDLATTLERIEKNFVITDPRLPDNPIIFASDSFLELTEFSREEILGRNCRFLQGPETDPSTVKKIRDAIDNQTEVTVQLINYTKSGKKFWNLFHLQPMRDQKGEVQYFIGVQLDGSQHVEPLHNCIPETTAKDGAILVKETAENVDVAVRELPDANMSPNDLWAKHSNKVHPKPHRRETSAWKAILKITESGEELGLKHFRPVKPLGSGDTGSVHLVELNGTGEFFAMKAMDKSVMINRNKVHRACAERDILDVLDHPFLPALYASFQTPTHVCLITDYCPGGELFMLLDRQPMKVLKEDAVRFYAAEVLVALEYLHCQGIIYRDLKPENVLIQSTGHVALTDFDLSCLTSCSPQLLVPEISDKKKKKKNKRGQQPPIFMAEPVRASNSFVGTEEYIAPEIISGVGHSSAVDWWAFGILLYEMFYGYTPFRGKTRQRTFANVLHKDLKFPSSISVSLPAKQLIYRLLHRDPKNRLGSREGASEVKRHQFFRGINWALVRSQNPPKLETPIFGGDDEEKVKEHDLGLQDLVDNVF